MSEPLKIGLLVDDDAVPLWAAEIIRTLNAGDYARVALIVRNMSPGEPLEIRDAASAPKGSLRARWLKLRRNASRLVYIAFWKADRVAKRWSNHFEEPQQLEELLPGVDVIAVTPHKSRYSDVIGSEDIDRIEAHDIDIFLRLGFRILRGRVLQAAKYGVWSFHHGDNRHKRGGPSGFWELTRQTPTAGVILQILSEDLDGGTVLSRSWHLPDILLLNRQRQNVFMQSWSHFPRQVKQLHDLGPERYFEQVRQLNQHPEFYSEPMYVAPTNIRATYQIGRHYLHYIASKLFRLVFFRQWVLLFHYRPSAPMSQSMWRYRTILPPRDRIWADPFVVERDGKYHVFMEELIFSEGRGRIATFSIDKEGRYTFPQPALDKPYHLSYPFLFEHDNELYMIPESAENRTVDAYRCVSFPDQWEHAATLMNDVFAVDATLAEHEGRWYMFVTMRNNDHTNCLDELFIFHADHPLSTEWTAHALNPVSTDVRNARPAGALFRHNGNLYRPAQNGSRRYGYGMKINVVDELSPENYREREVSQITPDWDWTINATHTLNHASGMSVSDASKLRFRYFRDTGSAAASVSQPLTHTPSPQGTSDKDVA